MLTRSRRRCIDATEEAAQQANIPALANLSDDLLLDCCKLLPVTSLVSFSACSKNLRQVANHGSLWTQLSIPPESAAGLTDQSLAGLLQRVDAKNYMVSISLVGCGQIDGSGLWPLHDSTALQAIDLRRAKLDRGRFKARRLATSAEKFLEQALPRLGSILITSSKSASKLRRTLAEAGLTIADSRPCVLCHELVPSACEGVRPLTAECGFYLREFCFECKDAFFRDCSDCGVLTCNRCLEFECTDDGREIYTCEDCIQYRYDGGGYGSGGCEGCDG